MSFTVYQPSRSSLVQRLLCLLAIVILSSIPITHAFVEPHILQYVRGRMDTKWTDDATGHMWAEPTTTTSSTQRRIDTHTYAATPTLQSKYIDSPSCDTLSSGAQEALQQPSECHNVLDYNITNFGLHTCLATVNAQVQTLPTLWALFPEPCRSAVAVLTCVLTHPKCSAPTQPPCASVCTRIAAYCGPAADQVYAVLDSQGFPTDCTQPPYDQSVDPIQCNSGPTTLRISTPPPGQTIQEKDTVRPAVPTCQIYSGSVCASVLGANSTIYIPFGLTQESLEEAVRVRYAWLFNLAPTANGCNTLFAQYICAKAFLPCTILTPLGAGGPSTVLPRPLCHSQCTEFKAACASVGLFKSLPQLEPNCEATGTLFPPQKDCNGTIIIPSTKPDFPDVSAEFAPGFSSRCNDYLTEQDGSPKSSNHTPVVTASCPFPLVVPDELDSVHIVGGGLCATPCPILIMDDSSYAKADIVLQVVVIASFALSFFTLVSWLIDPQKRQQHWIVGFIFFTLMLATWQLVQIILWREYKKIDPERYPHIAHSFCVTNTDIVQPDQWLNSSKAKLNICIAAIQIFNIMAIVHWWLLNSIDLFMKVVLGTRVTYPSKQWYMKEGIFFSLGIILPLLISTLCVAYDMSGGSGLGVGFLSVHTSTDPYASKNDTILDWPIFYLPVLLCCAIGIGCWTATMITFVRSTNSTAAGASGGSRGLRHYARAIVFLFVCFFVFAITFSFRGYAESHVDIWGDSAAEFVKCLLVDHPVSVATGQSEIIDCGTRPKEAPNEGVWLLFQAAISGLGVISFVIYGTMRDNLLLDWFFGKLQSLCPGCKCFESLRARSTTQRSQLSSIEMSQGAAGTTRKRQGSALTVSANGAARRPSTSAGGRPMPAARRPSSSGASIGGGSRVAPGRATPTPSAGPSRRGSLSQLQDGPLVIEVAEKGGGVDSLGKGVGHVRAMSQDERREAAEAKLKRFPHPSHSSVGDSPLVEDVPIDGENHPGLSIRVSVPKPLPPDSVFARPSTSPVTTSAAMDEPMLPVVSSTSSQIPAGTSPNPLSPAGIEPSILPTMQLDPIDTSVMSGSSTNERSSAIQINVAEKPVVAPSSSSLSPDPLTPIVPSPSSTSTTRTPARPKVRIHLKSPSKSEPPTPTP